MFGFWYFQKSFPFKPPPICIRTQWTQLARPTYPFNLLYYHLPYRNFYRNTPIWGLRRSLTLGTSQRLELHLSVAFLKRERWGFHTPALFSHALPQSLLDYYSTVAIMNLPLDLLNPRFTPRIVLQFSGKLKLYIVFNYAHDAELTEVNDICSIFIYM